MRGRNREIIVVDDGRNFLSAIVRLINIGGYSAVGLSSLADLRGTLPIPTSTCVLADILLAGESGLDAPEIPKENGFCGPVLFMTATDDLTLIESLSPVPCLRKPIEAGTLFAALGQVFQTINTPKTIR